MAKKDSCSRPHIVGQRLDAVIVKSPFNHTLGQFNELIIIRSSKPVQIVCHFMPLKKLHAMKTMYMLKTFRLACAIDVERFLLVNLLSLWWFLESSSYEYGFLLAKKCSGGKIRAFESESMHLYCQITGFRFFFAVGH
ncbi:hypothetical protein KFK09_003211 [Dendrobium nobile]|uniref:Uncharacterized protein n=1 Tax=Dendrobium nobile TaxID=94219 RepID=A0A8T3C9H5_DENNO|nr:hypothetical protein KFK09_003211 [Dendrobium nobile]